MHTRRTNGGSIMENETKDDIIQELWQINDKFASSCNNDIDQIIKTINKLAEEKGFHDKQINLRKEIEDSLVT